MQNNENNSKRAEREEIKTNKKKVFSSKKEFHKKSFIHDVRKKESNILIPVSRNIQFWSKHKPLLDVLN